jgi:hypothetical protein
VKDQVYSQKENMLDELKTRINAATADVAKDMLHCVER